VHSEELARRHALARERVAGGLPPASARHLGRVLPPSGVAVLEVRQNGWLLSRRGRSLLANASGLVTHRDSIISSGVAVLEGVHRAFDKDERLRAGKLQKLEAVRINIIATPEMHRNVGESQSLVGSDHEMRRPDAVTEIP
jgi:hypothetical protein